MNNELVESLLLTMLESGATLYLTKDQILHRTDGPAIEYKNGTKAWYKNGKRHRDDGPAIERADGSKEWWINGKYLTAFEVWTLFGIKL